MKIMGELTEAYNNALNNDQIKLMIYELINYLGDIEKEKANNKTIATLLKNALLELGYVEKSKKFKNTEIINSKYEGKGNEDENITKYAAYMDEKRTFYKGVKQGEEWCDVFVDYLFDITFGEERARELLRQSKSRVRGAGVNMSLMYFASYDPKVLSEVISNLDSDTKKTEPKVGSQIFFQNENKKLIHTGFVFAVDLQEGYIYSIEGNTSPQTGKVEPAGLGVYLKKYKINDNRIFCSMRPDFKNYEDINQEQASKILSMIKQIYETIYRKYILPIEENIKENIQKNSKEKMPKIYGLEKLKKSVDVLLPHLRALGIVIIEDTTGIIKGKK